MIAMSDEIDRWLRSAPTAESSEPLKLPTSQNLEELRASLKLHHELHSLSQELRRENMAMLSDLCNRLKNLQGTIGDAGLTQKL